MTAREYTVGVRGTVLLSFDARRRSPAADFLDDLQEHDKRKFEGNFTVLGELGPEYRNKQRFKALQKSLWEFKEHDHRLYCFRKQVGSHVYAVLLTGWSKDKAGKGQQEAREIRRALKLTEAAAEALESWLHQRRRT